MRKLISPKAALFLALFLVCEGILLTFYIVRPSLHDVLAFAATVVAAAFALFEFLQKSQHDRFESAAAFISRWNDPAQKNIRTEVRAMLTNALLVEPLIKKSEDLHQFSDEQKQKRGEVIMVLNFFEEMSVAVQRGRADERYLYDYFKSTVEELWNKLYNFIQADRKFGKPSYWSDFEKLATNWRKGLHWWL
jgi:uncharacterized protein DUF4760